MTLYSYKPLWQVKAFFSLSFSSIGICQYPLFKSKVMKNIALPRTASISSITGNGQLDILEMRLSFLKFLQNPFEPSFLSTITIGKLHGDLECQITLAPNISSTALSTIGILVKGVLYSFNFIGL